MRYQGTIKVLLLFLFSACMSISAFSQSITVEGIVTSEADGEPLPGVNVVIQGTSQGTSTNMEGYYSLDVPNENSVLVFSFLGFRTQEINVDGRTEINVFMSEASIQGEELIVVGYGSQERADLTGSISRINAADITKQPSLTATEALQGKVAGVNIINNDAPGSSPSVIMRGLGTALGGRNPLFIVDGAPADGIDNISPSDIESIDFLKDASAASIYGLRAANGVIIVTTKEGRRGAPQFEIDTYSGYTAVLNQVDMANASEYITYFNEENAVLGAFQLSENQQYNTDWYNELLEAGYALNSTVSVSGGSDHVNYFFSYNLNNEKGILNDQQYLRQTLRNNNDFRLFNDFLTIDQNLSISVTRDNPMPFGAFNTAYRQSPLVPTFYPNGRYGQSFVNETTGEVTYEGSDGDVIGRLNTHGNPLTPIDFNNQQRNAITLQGNIAANLNLTDNLTFTSRLGSTQFYTDFENFSPIREQWIAGDPTRTNEQYQASKDANPGVTTWADNVLSVSNEETLRWNWDNYFNYERRFDRHDVDVTLGMSSEKVRIGRRFSGTAYDIPSREQYWNLDMASDDYEKNVDHTNFTPSTLLSFFGRIQYNYDQRYYITGNLRRDGSSQFANTEDYWEFFPSIGLGWTISNEDFMDVDFINFLKFRASWGQLGNQNVPFNSTVINTSTGSGSQNYVFGPGQDLYFGASVGSPAQDITWEIVEEWNFGADFEMLNNRLTGAIDIYQKTTENLILLINPLLNSPFEGTYFDHGGEVVNKGAELTANWSNNISNDFSYIVGGSFSFNNNEVVSVEPGYEGQTGGSLGNGQITKRLEAGQPLGSWWMYEVDGVWQNQDEIDNNSSVGGALPGHLRYKDQNDDGIIDDRDKKFFGSYIPTFNYGINLGLNYKQIDFSLDAYGVGGNNVYDGLNNTRFGGENTTKEMYDNRWTGEGSTNEHPGANRDAIASNYYLESGAFLRINNITLGYSLPDLVEQVSNVRFYVSAQNPFIITRYPGFTPELASNGNPYGTAGIELAAYPNTRTLLFGINIDF